MRLPPPQQSICLGLQRLERPHHAGASQHSLDLPVLTLDHPNRLAGAIEALQRLRMASWNGAHTAICDIEH